MSSAEIEMVDFSITLCIDAALAVIGETRNCRLGFGWPTTGVRFHGESRFLRSLREEILQPYCELSRRATGHEAWWAPNVRLTAIFDFMLGFSVSLMNVTHSVVMHCENICSCRQGMDKVIADLKQKRNAVLTLSLSDPLSARALATTAAKAAMDRYHELVRILQSSTASVLAGTDYPGAKGINEICVEVETFLAMDQSVGNVWTAFSPATGTVSMPTVQLLRTSSALSEYATGLKSQSCGPEFLTEVETTHGQLSVADFIPALSRFVELHNLLLATLSTEVQLLAENMGTAAEKYILSDDAAAEVITELASSC